VAQMKNNVTRAKPLKDSPSMMPCGLVIEIVSCSIAGIGIII
jgi:hypothetical protein